MGQSQANTTQLQELLNLASEGNQGAYGQLVALSSERLLRLTRKMLHDYQRLKRWEDTDDVFQTAVMKLYQSLFQVRPASVREFFGLAATQIRRTLIDLARHYYGPEGPARKHQSDGKGLRGESPLMEGRAGSEERPESLEEWVRFHQLIEQLPRLEREVFHLLWYAGLPQSEVATLLGLSLSTVQRRWYRGQQLLGAAMQGEGRSAGDAAP